MLFTNAGCNVRKDFVCIAHEMSFDNEAYR